LFYLILEVKPIDLGALKQSPSNLAIFEGLSYGQNLTDLLSSDEIID
jgi:hypothetical protein